MTCPRGSDGFFWAEGDERSMMASAQSEDAQVDVQAASRPARGVFIVLEGIDGSGKSTVAKAVHEALAAEMPDRAVLTAEPTSSFIGEAVRAANAGDVDLLAEALLFVADRAEHTRQIKAWLDQGKVVVCDRYHASTIAYQGALLGERFGSTVAAVEWLRLVNEPAIVRPDLVLLLQVDVGVALARLRSRRELTKFERDGYLADVDRIYRLLAEQDPSFVALDASQPHKRVAAEALRAIRSKL